MKEAVREPLTHKERTRSKMRTLSSPHDESNKPQASLGSSLSVGTGFDQSKNQIRLVLIYYKERAGQPAGSTPPLQGTPCDPFEGTQRTDLIWAAAILSRQLPYPIRPDHANLHSSAQAPTDN